MRIEDKFKPARRAPVWADVPDEKWNDWRWQLTNRLNSVEELEQVIHLTESEKKALTTNGLFQEEALFAPLAVGTLMMLAGLVLGATSVADRHPSPVVARTAKPVGVRP